MRRIGEFWLRYGYAMNSPVVPPGDFRCMEHFTYWKMAEMNISPVYDAGDVPSDDQGVFSRRESLWLGPDDDRPASIGRTTKPLKGDHR